MSTTLRNGHATEGDLVRLIDGELDGAGVDSLRAHLERCTDCAALHRRIRERSDRLATLLDRSAAATGTPPLPYPAFDAHGGTGIGAGRRWWRIAAAIALLLAAGLLAPPVRAWVAEQVGWSPDTATPATTPEPATTTLRFEAQESPVVRVVRPGPGALLLLGRGDEAVAVLELERSGADVVVLPDGIRLEGGPAGAIYRLSMPPGIDRVVLRREGADARLTVPEDGWTRIRLGP